MERARRTPGVMRACASLCSMIEQDRYGSRQAGLPATGVEPDRPVLRRLAAGLVIAGACGEVISLTGIVGGPVSRILGALPFLPAGLAGSFVLYLRAAPSPANAIATSALGVLLAWLCHLVAVSRGIALTALAALAIGLGCAAVLSLGLSAGRSSPRFVGGVGNRLFAALVLPLYTAVSQVPLGLTVALSPTILDQFALQADAGFGTQISFVLGRLFQDLPVLASVSSVIYNSLALLLLFVFVELERSDTNMADSFLVSVVCLGLFGFLVYLLFPVVGPLFYLPKAFPSLSPDLPAVASRVPFQPIVRNCMPSLHCGWALLALWASRPLPGIKRLIVGLLTGVTVLATLGLGLHYVVDLAAAVPFTLAVLATVLYCGAAGRSADSQALRTIRLAVATGWLAAAGWLLLVRFSSHYLATHVVITWLLAAATVIGCTILAARLLAARAARRPSEGAVPQRAGTKIQPLLLALSAIFAVSGFAGLVYQVLFAKCLALTFGSTAVATTVVLATFMGGLAFGTWVGGLWAPRLRSCVRAYAVAEAAVALWCIATPWLLSAVQGFYVRLGQGTNPGHWSLLALQLVLGSLILVPPTFLMGLTAPLLTQHLTGRGEGAGGTVALLYGANTVGAAAGALISGYVLLPALGIRGTLSLGVLLNLTAAAGAWLLSSRLTLHAGQPTRGRDGIDGSVAQPSLGELSIGRPDGAHSLGLVAVALLAVGGFVTFGLESTYVHLLAVVAGNSAYAFSLMLFAFLIGLGGGASVARRRFVSTIDVPMALIMAELALAASVLLGVYLWESIPGYFSTFAGYATTRSFGAREFVRFAVCSLAMVPPAFFIGFLYPVAMEGVARAFPGRVVPAIYRTSALNTAGNILGALVTGFLLLPRLGSLRTLHVCAGLSLMLALVATIVLRRAAWKAWLSLAGVSALLVAQPASFDMTELSTGANVYFLRQGWGRVIDYAESLDGGLTSVAESQVPSGGKLLTLLTNGKFQGDDNKDKELVAQSSFAIAPLLHSPLRGRALVIGLGTGTSGRVLSDAGFGEIDVVELSEDIVRMATAHFGSVNGAFLKRPGVTTYVTDGRNYLLLQPRLYDVISMEISSIWFAGASSLYNQEFYDLVRRRLRPDGVFQQWVQLHRISTWDITTVLATVRSRFRYVWLYFLGGQGIIVASNAEALPGPEALARLEGEPGLAATKSLFGGSFMSVLFGRLLTPTGLDRLLREAGNGVIDDPRFLATDDNLSLEFSTPRGNVRDYTRSLGENVGFLARYRSSDPAEGTRLSFHRAPSGTPRLP